LKANEQYSFSIAGVTYLAEESKMKPIIITIGDKTPLRVLRPSEFEAIRNALPTDSHRIFLDLALYSGMKYEELVWFAKHPTSFEESTSKIKTPNRTIRLSVKGLEAVKGFIAGPKKVRTRQGWSKSLKVAARAAKIDDTGLSAKTLRKTMESWLVGVHVLIEKKPTALQMIAESFGHTPKTALEHCINLDFTDVEVRKIKSIVKGWLNDN